MKLPKTLFLTVLLVGCGGEPEPTPSNIFVGELSSNDTAIAVLAHADGEAVVYACNGVDTSTWFFGTVSGDAIVAESDSGLAVQATIADGQVAGTVELSDGAVEFSANLATGVAGMYLVEQTATRAEGFSANGARLEADLAADAVSGTVTAVDGDPISLDGTVRAFGEETGVATWIVQADGDVKGRVTQTSGGGNCSIWSKIKQVAFGVDCTFF